MVIFVFLRKFWATVIPSVALPLTLIGTFGVMKLVGFSLDNLSLMALTISTGFVVDDAIVMIENIVRFIEKGEAPMAAALKGAKQIGFTVISLSFSLIAVFIPLLFMTGIVGRLFREFAITLSVAVAVSAIVSLTLTPMMCARLLKSEAETKHGRLYLLTERMFQGLLDAYDRSLQWVLRHQAFTLGVAIVTLVATIWLYVIVPKGLLPQQDTGLIVGVTDSAQSISFKAMVARQRAIADIVRRDPDVVSVASFVGAGTVNATVNSGRLYINLKPRDSRKASASQIIDRLRAATDSVEGISLFMQAAQDVQIDSRVSRTQYQYTLKDADVVELAEWAPKLLTVLRNKPELTDVASRPAVRRLAGQRGRGPREGLAPERAHAGHRRHALRRLRPAPGLHHLHPAQPVPRHPRSRAAVTSSTPESLEPDLRQVQHRADGAAERLRQSENRHRAADHRPPGPVPGGDALLQPAARAARWARR